MNDTILISSDNFNGQLANVVFKPDNSFDVINLGDVLLPFLFEPNLLTTPREVYGVYTILVISCGCPNFLTVVRPIIIEDYLLQENGFLILQEDFGEIIIT